jgi:5-methylthioribose kinase
MPDKGARIDPKMLLKGAEVMDRLTNRNMSRLGLLDGDVNSLKLNSLTLLTAETLFRTSDLRPDAFGLDQ